MRRSNALMLGAAVLGGLLVLSVVAFGVLSTASAFPATGSDSAVASSSGSNNTTNGTALPPPCAGPGLPPPPNPVGNATGNATAAGNGTGLPPPPCGGPRGPPPIGSGGCPNMTAVSNSTTSGDGTED
jgi:hypothetical protein